MYSRWEASEAWALDRNENVEAWVKNDDLGFDISYTYQTIFHKYRPDFIIKLPALKKELDAAT